MNTEAVSLKVRHVPPQNLVFWLTGSEAATQRTSNLVVDTEIQVQSRPDEMMTSWVDIGRLVQGEQRGLYELSVRPVYEEAEEEEEDPETADTGWSARRERERRQAQRTQPTSVARMLLTDLQLVAKASEVPGGQSWARYVDVWVLNTHTGEPRYAAEVDAVKASGQVMASCTTDATGGCRIELPEAGVDTAGPVALFASHGDDLMYLKFDEVKAPISESEIGGEPYLAQQKYRASIYNERGVYRPGETVHLAAVVRDDSNHQAPAQALPLLLEVVDPRQKVIKKWTVETNAAGMLAWDWTLGNFASTGAYQARLKAGEQVIGTLGFNVEEFVPERMKVEAKPQAPAVLRDDPVGVDVHARYLFGGSAEGSRVELNCKLEAASFQPRKNRQYSYGPVLLGQEARDLQTSMTVGSTEGTIGEDDTASLRCPGTDEVMHFRGAAHMVADVAVFEAGSGRTTRGSTAVTVHPATHYIGLQTGAASGEVGEKMTVSGIVVDWDGSPFAAVSDVELEFYRMEVEYGWWWYADYRHFRENRDLYLRPVREGAATAKVGADGTFTANYTPKGRGAAYVIRARTADGARTDLRLDGSKRYNWYTGTTSMDQTPRPLKPTSIEVTLPDEVEVGKRAVAKLEVPFDGHMLVSVETHEVLHHEWFEVKAGETEWNFKVDDFVPNVYVSAFLVKDPHLDSKEAFTPDRAFGVSRVRVKPSAYVHAVKLDVPSTVRSNSTLKVGVDVGKTSGPTYVTVAAVDEGILSLTRFETPDPKDALFPIRRLGVHTYETIGWTMNLPAAGASSETGGDGAALEGRVQPVKPVALWSGLVEVGKDGKAVIELDVPQYRGALRVMAVASSPGKVGSAEAEVIVRDPLVLQTTLPRFLIAGDTFDVPVFLTNMSGKDRDIKVSLAADNLGIPGLPADPNAPAPLEFVGAREATVSLEDGKSKTVVFQARAAVAIGAAHLTVKAESDNLVSYDELDVPFNPNGPKERVVQTLALEEGTTNVAALLDGWVPTTEHSTLWVTPNPYGESMSHLKYLVRYPYGCIEQTTSSTRPLLYVSSLLEATAPEVLADKKVDDMVMHGVDRILSMQTPSGGFGYWPGASEPVLWGSAYATHMLLDAKDAGYAVPQERLEAALKYLSNSVQQSEGRPASFDKYRYSEPYHHYVLARAGRANKARIKQLVKGLPDKPVGADAEVAYMLKAALYLAGDRRYEQELRNPDASKLTGERRNNWSFYSDLRRRGFALAIYHDLFGNEGESAEPLARLVAGGLKGKKSRWYTTQELVWGITGLGKHVEVGSKSFGKPTLIADGTTLKSEPLAGLEGKAPDQIFKLNRASEYGQLDLVLPKKAEGKLYLVASSEGIRENATWRTGGQGLTVARSYYDAEGQPLPLEKMKLGDMVYVRVTVTNNTGDAVQNLALVDRLPAGWEIENPRLGRGGNSDVVPVEGDLWQADYLNVRDDRLELFGHLESRQTRTVVYATRAVTSGQFTLPPVEVEAMYNPEIWARELGGEVVIAGPWEGLRL